MPAASIGQAWRIVPFSGNRTISIDDVTTLLRSTDGVAQVVTFPPDDDTLFSEGDQLSFMQGGAGALSFAPGAGVTIESRGALLDATDQFAVISAIKQAADDTWALFGDLA